MSDKKYTAKEAAVMVLAKAQELYKTSTLAKGDWAKIHSKLEREGYSKESADKIDGAIKAKVNEKKMKKDEDMGDDMAMSEDEDKKEDKGSEAKDSEKNPDAKEDAELGENVESLVENHENDNKEAEDKEAQMKGHIKLAKFMGRMEHKKGMKAMDKGDDMMPPQAPNMSGQSQPAAAPMKMSMSEKK